MQVLDFIGIMLFYCINIIGGFNGVGECVNDLDYQWIVVYLLWNGGVNDGWLLVQVWIWLVVNMFVVMGYYVCFDILIYYLLVDIFMICDQYFLLFFGGMMFNWFYWISVIVNFDGD